VAHPNGAVKKIDEIDVRGAPDISSAGALGVTPLGGTKTIEQATVTELASAGIVGVSKRLGFGLVDLGYPHDKPEGLALGPGGMLFVVDDDDFGIVADDGEVIPKLLPPTGAQDFVTVWQIRLPSVP
jgi:hypothetical protein